MREEDKTFIDREMKRLCYMGILKEGFSAYSSPVMLISRKFTKDKSGYRFQTSKCENSKEQFSLSISQRHIFSIRKLHIQGTVSNRSKDAFCSTEVIRKFKKILWNTPIFWQLTLFISKHAHEIEHLTIHMAVIY